MNKEPRSRQDPRPSLSRESYHRWPSPISIRRCLAAFPFLGNCGGIGRYFWRRRRGQRYLTRHRSFLNAGGLGILVGDGKLPHPGLERIIETYYSLPLFSWRATVYQLI